MYYSAGTYEAFAKPEKPEGADRKSAYIIGTGREKGILHEGWKRDGQPL